MITNERFLSTFSETQAGRPRFLSRQLSDLVIYTRSIEFPGFDSIRKSKF